MRLWIGLVVGGALWVAVAAHGRQGGGTELSPDVWVHQGDTDGDGLYDSFEARYGLDVLKVDSFGDGTMDEYRLAADGRAMWEVLEAELNAPPPGAGGGGGCGATGLEALALLALFCLCRDPRR